MSYENDIEKLGQRISLLKSRIVGIEKRLTELSLQRQGDSKVDKVLTEKISSLLAIKRSVTRSLEESVKMVLDVEFHSIFEDDLVDIPKRYRDIYNNTDR
jgi:predicted  nucleic acid-binding Zn-ribbon protein